MAVIIAKVPPWNSKAVVYVKGKRYDNQLN